jgi:diacylglycerol kinase family enzyme
MAGAGLDALVTDWVEKRKGIFRKIPKILTYFLFGFASIFRYPYPSLRFMIDGSSYTGSTGIVTKARCVAGPYIFSPKSDLRTPMLTLCLFQSRGFMAHLFLSARFILTGRCGRGVQYIQGKEITIQKGNVRVQADGEGIGKLPARFHVSNQPILLVYPNKPC